MLLTFHLWMGSSKYQALNPLQNKASPQLHRRGHHQKDAHVTRERAAEKDPRTVVTRVRENMCSAAIQLSEFEGR